jgi:hypothetical protein
MEVRGREKRQNPLIIEALPRDDAREISGLKIGLAETEGFEHPNFFAEIRHFQ